MTSRHPVVVIGAGLAGLTAALHLIRSGIPVTLLESDAALPGGRLKGGEPHSFEHNSTLWEFPGEHGIHGVWGQYHNFRAMLTREGIDPGWVPAREEAWILRHPGGRVQWARSGSALRASWIPAPLHYLALFVRPRFLQLLTLRDLACMFRVLGALIFATGYDPAVEMSRLDRLTLADFFRGWSPTLQSLFLGLARNFTSARPDQVPQSGFIAFLRFYTLLRRDSWNFSYFAQDSHRAVIAPLVERITQGGGNLMLGAHVTDLERNGTRWRVRWQSEGTSQVVDADQVILALDIPGTRKLLTHSLDAKALTFPLAVPSAILRYWFDCAPTGGIAGPEAGIFTGEFVLDNYFWLHRFQEPFVRWHAVTGGSAIECHIYGPPELLAEPDAVILARGAQELQRVWSDLRGALVTQSIRRNPAAHSLFSGETERSLAVQTPWPGVWACGDWLRYPHPALYMERAIVTGIAAANGVLQSLGQPEHPIIPVDRPEVLARGIEAGLRWIRRQARRAKTRRAAQ